MKSLIGLFAFFGLLTGTAQAAPTGSPVRILVSVGEMGPDKDLDWRREACGVMHDLGNQMITGGVQITCRNFDPLHAIDTYLQQLKKDNTYHIRLLRGFKGSFRLSITNWNRTLESDFNTVGWSIGREPHTEARRADGIKSIVANFYSFIRDEEALKSQWLLSARNHTEVVSYDFKDLSFRSKKDRKKISVIQAAQLFEKENAVNAKYLRTRQEMSVLFSTVLPVDGNILKPDSSLETILIRAARQARVHSDFWKEVVRPDDRSTSDLTSYLIENDDGDPADWQNLSGLLGLDASRNFEIPPMIERTPVDISTSFPAARAATAAKKSSARLIRLF